MTNHTHCESQELSRLRAELDQLTERCRQAEWREARSTALAQIVLLAAAPGSLSAGFLAALADQLSVYRSEHLAIAVTES